MTNHLSNPANPVIQPQPLVSVVMPCYNVAATLEEAVESVLCQTYRHFELILVDDGSTDGVTPTLCDNYATNPHVRVVHQSNAGLAGARNTGLRVARGEFIALLDSDDLYEPEKLAAHVQHFASNPELGLSFSYSRFITDEGRVLPLVQGGRVSNVQAEHILCRNPVGNGSAAVLRRTALDDVVTPRGNRDRTRSKEYFNTQLRQSEDVEFWCRLVCTTQWRAGGIDQPLTRYRLNNAGLSANTTKQLATWETFLEMAATYAPELVRTFGHRARAYQLRYLCRRSLQLKSPVAAFRFMKAALVEDLGIIWQEPGRTLGTMAACAGALVCSPLLALNLRLHGRHRPLL